MSPTTSSLQPLALLRRMEPTSRPITSTFATVEKPIRKLTFQAGQPDTFSFLAKDAKTPKNAVLFNPIGKYPKWGDSEYRQAYLLASIEQGIAWQIRINRKKRGLSQEKLAEMLDTQQSAISRLEDPEYGSHSLDTLVTIANAFDCALSVKFIPFSQLAIESADLSQDALYAESYENETQKILDIN